MRERFQRFAAYAAVDYFLMLDDADHFGDKTPSPVLIRDVSGVIHSVVKNPSTGIWAYCDIAVLADWLSQSARNVVPSTERVTCLACLAEGHDDGT